MTANYYDLLGVARDAGDKEVRQAYRKLAREHHPDVNGGDQASEEKFKQINEAYRVLSDPEKRQKYDKYGDNWANWEQIEAAQARSGPSGNFRWSNFGGGGDAGDAVFDFGGGRGNPFEDLFANLGQDLRRPAPVEYAAAISLEEAFSGTPRVLELPQGRRLEVKIPPGVDDGSRVRVAAGGGQQGAVYVVVSVEKHAKFQRKGRNLYTDVEAPLEDAVLGGEITVPTLGGRVALTIPPETQNGRQFRLAGQGMPELRKSDQRGDLYATVNVKLPTGLSQEQRDLFQQLRESRAGQGG